jgi:hypothetical protein
MSSSTDTATEDVRVYDVTDPELGVIDTVDELEGILPLDELVEAARNALTAGGARPHRRSYPPKLPERYRWHWDHPWTAKARGSAGFRRWLRRHGRLSPNFTLAEAGGQHRHPLGTKVPVYMRRRAQGQAFMLERLRHALGDVSIPVGSWYRNPRHNAAVGGASQSRHMKADATDIFRAFVDAIGPARFDRIAGAIYADDGFGDYPSGSRHVDNRGYRARW